MSRFFIEGKLFAQIIINFKMNVVQLSEFLRISSW